MEDEVLDYEKFLAVAFSEEVRKVLRSLEVEDSLILGLTTIELASFIPDTATGRLRKVETFLFYTSSFEMPWMGVSLDTDSKGELM